MQAKNFVCRISEGPLRPLLLAFSFATSEMIRRQGLVILNGLSSAAGLTLINWLANIAIVISPLLMDSKSDSIYSKIRRPKNRSSSNPREPMTSM